MNDLRYSSEEECRAFIAQQLRLKHLPNKVSREVAARLASGCGKQAAPRLGLGLRMRSWVIRQEDLGFFAVLSTGSLAAIASMTEPSATVPIAGAFIAAAEAGWNVWRKGARLDPSELQVLILLEASDGLRPKEIADRLSNEKKKWSAKEVESILKRLSRLPTRNGTIAVADKDSRGCWRSSH